MIKLQLAPDANISVNTFIGKLFSKTDWQEWVRVVGGNHSTKDTMTITIVNHKEVTIETVTLIDDNEFTQTEKIELDIPPRDANPDDAHNYLLKQWVDKVDKRIKEFIES